jgi:hypothetical protein
MVQPNERVFYDNDSIFISQYRFVTPKRLRVPYEEHTTCLGHR